MWCSDAIISHLTFFPVAAGSQPMMLTRLPRVLFPPGRRSFSASLEAVSSLCRRRGFVFPSSEVYGSLSGFFDYGPLGVEMKNNIKQLWWAEMVRRRPDVVGLDSAIISPAQQLKASGHIEEFSDELVDCRHTKLRYRADQVYWAKVECDDNGSTREIGYISFVDDGVKTIEEMGKLKAKQLAKKHGMAGKLLSPLTIRDVTEANENLSQIPGPDSGVVGSLTAPRKFNLMFETSLGPIASEECESNSRAYLRPETAQGIFTNFLNVQRTSRLKIPFGIAQIGKAFRNEITPRNFVFRSREFEQMEIEYFIPPENFYREKYFNEWIDASWNFLIQVGVKKSMLRIKSHGQDQLAHYADAVSDIEFEYPFGYQELMGVALRGSFDLDCHARGSGKSFEYLDKENFAHIASEDESDRPSQRKYVPHCIEPSVGIDRLFLAILVSSYEEEELDNGEKRTVLRLDRKVAPVKVAVLPIVKNNKDILARAEEVLVTIRNRYNCEFDTSGAIGRRYRRADEIGVPLCVTIDFDTLEDGSVTLRDRDTMEQRRVAISELERVLMAEFDAGVGL